PGESTAVYHQFRTAFGLPMALRTNSISGPPFPMYRSFPGTHSLDLLLVEAGSAIPWSGISMLYWKMLLTVMSHWNGPAKTMASSSKKLMLSLINLRLITMQPRLPVKISAEIVRSGFRNHRRKLPVGTLKARSMCVTRYDNTASSWTGVLLNCSRKQLSNIASRCRNAQQHIGLHK